MHQDHFSVKPDYLQDFVDNAAVALHWVDGAGVIRWANAAELDMLGYSAEEYIGQPISAFHADREKINDILERLGQNETLHSYEARLRCKDGSIKTVSISSNVYRKHGEFVHTRCFTIDITAQKQAEIALRQSESRYQQLIQSLPAAMYTTDANGRIVLYNAAAAALWGRKPVIGVDTWCASCEMRKSDGTPLPLEESPMAITLKEGRPLIGQEIIFVLPNGQQRYILAHPQPLFNEYGHLDGGVNMLLDITDMKRTEAALRTSDSKLRGLMATLEKKVEARTTDLLQKNEELQKSEERYHKMVEEVEDYAILLLDKTGIICNWNTGAQKIKGYTEEEIIGKHFRIFYLPEDRQSHLPEQLIAQATDTGKAIHEGWRIRKDGTKFWGSIVITALHDKHNNLIGFSKVTRDLSDRKNAEDKIRQYTGELEFQNKELEQFVYIASHDLKEPLRKVQFYSDYVAEKNAGQLDAKGAEYLNRAISAAHRMQQLIDDLLTYSKTTNSISPELLEMIDTTEIAKEIALLHRDEEEANNIRIEIGPLPVLRAIPFQVRQLMDNLVNNAIKYKHPTRTARISITGNTVKGYDTGVDGPAAEAWYNEISVTDNGTGFDPQHAQKIFEIFQRLHNKSEFPGSGIGLAICKKIMQQHGGFIKASGKPDEGARFDVYFPV